MDKRKRKQWISVLITAGLIAAAGLMLFLRPSDRLCSLVPDHAAWYLEAHHPESVLKDVENGILPLSDSGLSVISKLRNELAFAKELFTGRNDLLTGFAEADFGISAHSITEEESGYVFYLACPEEYQTEVFSILEKKFRGKDSYRLENREYLGEKILEISGKKGIKFSLTYLKNALVGSFSGFLLEEIIRNAGVFLKPGFASRLSSDPRYQHVQSARVKLFIQNKNLPAYVRQYLSSPEAGLLDQMGEAMVLGILHASETQLEFQGFCLSKEGEKINGPLHVSRLQSFIPAADAVMSFQLGKQELWTSLSGTKKPQSLSHNELEQALEGEVLMVLTEGQGLKKYDHLLLAPVKDEKMLNQCLQAAAGSGPATILYEETYRGIQIRKHSNPGLAKNFFGKHLEGWSASFYAMIGSCFVLSDQIELLRRCADEHLQGNKNLPVSLNPSWFHFESSPSRITSNLLEKSTGAFRKSFREWLPLLKSIRQISFSDLGESKNPGISLKINLKIPEELQDSLTLLNKVFLDSVIISNPFHANLQGNGKNIWLLQDLKKQAHFLDENLDIKASIKQVDYWIGPPRMVLDQKPGDFSVVFSFPKKTEVLRADGTASGDFGFTMPDSLAGIQFTSLIDYDQSLQYRLFMASRHGYILALDQKGQLLDGWKPWKNQAGLALPPRHCRIGSKDFLLFLDARGNLILTNRKGDIQPGFPYKLRGDSYCGWFVELGLDAENSYVYCLSELGQMEKVSFSGKQASYLQLFRPELSTRFILCTDQKERSFILARTGNGTVTIFDQTYRPILEHKSGGKKFSVQHFQFGSSNKVLAVTDLDEKKCTLYNESGMPILKKSFPATRDPVIFPSPVSEGKFRILAVFENRVSLAEFSKN